MSLETGRVVSFETFRRERESRRARVLPYLAPTEQRPPWPPFRGVELTDREVEHRQRMLRHLLDGEVGTPEGVADRGRQYETTT